MSVACIPLIEDRQALLNFHLWNDCIVHYSICSLLLCQIVFKTRTLFALDCRRGSKVSLNTSTWRRYVLQVMFPYWDFSSVTVGQASASKSKPSSAAKDSKSKRTAIEADVGKVDDEKDFTIGQAKVNPSKPKSSLASRFGKKNRIT